MAIVAHVNAAMSAAKNTRAATAPATTPIPPGEAPARELMRTKAYSDPNHPDPRVTQTAVRRVFEKLYPEGS